jgi:hypothetical protein
LSLRHFKRGELYKQTNFSGFDPEELEKYLKGFQKLEFIDLMHFDAQPLAIYDAKITKIAYYRAVAEQDTFWSFAFTDSGKLVFVNLED